MVRISTRPSRGGFQTCAPGQCQLKFAFAFLSTGSNQRRLSGSPQTHPKTGNRLRRVSGSLDGGLIPWDVPHGAVLSARDRKHAQRLAGVRPSSCALPTKKMLRFHEAIRRGRLARRTLSGQGSYGYGFFALLGPSGYGNVVHDEAGFDRVAL
jgi:hypothetical protein